MYLCVFASITETVWDSVFAASKALPSGLTGSWMVSPPHGPVGLFCLS
jgi:hypothetical protein